MARNSLPSLVTAAGRCDRTRSVARKACRNSPRNWIGSPRGPVLSTRRHRQFQLGAVAVGDGAPCLGQRDAAVGRHRPHPRLVDLDDLGIGEVAQPLALHTHLEPAVLVETLDHEVVHRVVGLLARRRALARLIGEGVFFTSRHVPSAEHQHQHQGQVSGQHVARSLVPGQRRAWRQCAQRQRPKRQGAIEVGQVQSQGHGLQRTSSVSTSAPEQRRITP